MADKLQEICEKKKEQIKHEKEKCSLENIINLAKKSLLKNPVRPFQKSLENRKTGLICEIKKASPSVGLIREDFNPANLAKAYEAGGASCLSVLTDEPYFQGRNEYLVEAREACALPVLRKDFMIDVWQVAQARSLGADCILLIMAVLNDKEALELHNVAIDLNMDVLIESHNEEELKRALQLPSGMIGINNRNLKTLEIDLETSIKLRSIVPNDRMIVCESGLKTRDDLILMQSHGINNFLIGETLMKQDDVEKATKAIMPPTP